MQRPGGIGGNELDDHPLAFAEPRFRHSAAPSSWMRPISRRVRRGRQEEIDEAGAGDLGPIDEGARGQGGHDGLRELPRIAARRFGMTQCNVGGEVAMLRVAGALDGDRRVVQRELAQGFAKKLLELLLQMLNPATFGAPSLPEADSVAFLSAAGLV